MRYKRLTVAKTTDAGKDRGIAFLKHPYIKGENMAHLISGLMSWMKSGMSDRHRNDLLTWAKTEYKKDWRYAYQFMLDHNGQAPSLRELNGPNYGHKEVA